MELSGADAEGTAMGPLQVAVEGWSPAPRSRTTRLDGAPLRAFAALLDQPAPPSGHGDPLPLGWHWFSFLEHLPTAELGPDGHPRDGAFLPPVPHRRRMFAGGRLKIGAPLRVGDEVTRTTELAGATVKQGSTGDLLFVTERSTFTRDGEPLLVEEQDLVYRSEPPGTERPAPPAPAPSLEQPAGELAVELLPDPVVLFRFSALTGNAHRIHYDQPYATGVEGFPGLVVHGPLLALLLLEVPRRHLPERTVAEFEYRLRRPAHAGTPVRATGSLDGDRLVLQAAAGSAAPSITGTAALGGGRNQP